MKNIRLVILGEFILFLIVFFFTISLSEARFGAIPYFIEIPSLLMILVILIPGLFITGVMKDFIKSFSVGIKHFSLLELKNIIGAVSTAQKLILYGALFAIITESILLMGYLSDLRAIGPNLAIIFLAGFYAVLLEFLIMPLKLNAERKMNEEMDLGDE